MGHTLGEIFTHAQSLNLKNRNSWAGRVLVGHHVRCSEPSQPQPGLSGLLLQAAAETTASGSTGKEDLKADRRVRHYSGFHFFYAKL